MDYLPAVSAAILGAIFGWTVPGYQHLLYRQPEHRAAPASGRKLLLLRLFLAAGCAASGALALRPAHYDAGPAVLTLAFCWVLFVLSSTDFERRIIPNRLSYPAIVAALAVCWAWPDRSWEAILAGGAIALAIGGALFVLGLFFGGALGLGDVKLMLLGGLLAGWPAIFTALVIGIVAAGIPGLALTVAGRGRTYFSYGPYLALGLVIVLLWPARFV